MRAGPILRANRGSPRNKGFYMSQTPTQRGFDRSERTGSPALVLLFSIVFVGAAIASTWLPPELGVRLTVGLLALLGLIGVVALFAYAVGFVQISGQAARNDLTKLMTDSSIEGLIVTEADTRIIYANEAYLRLSGAREGTDLRTVERLFSGAPDVSEAIYRLAQAAREGKRGSEELRLSPALAGGGEVGWYRIRVRPLERFGRKRATLWMVADVTRERERHENVFQELQHAIDFLDHAPAGFFASDGLGSVSYINATLADWLDYDLTQVGSGGLTLSSILAGDRAELLTSITGEAGDVKTQSFDVELKTRTGETIAVRLLHRIAFGQDGQPGPSRTLVLKRSADDAPANNLHAAELRFARFFNQTPMAIAALDSHGRILRSNAAFSRLAKDARHSLSDNDDLIFARIVERDRAALEAAFRSVLQGASDVAPVDAELSGDGGRSARFFISPAEDGTDGTAATIFALDTTEQRNLQETFLQAQKMQAIGQLAGGVAHDFNNVLTAIIGYSDLLLSSHRPTDPSFQDIMQIKQNANRAAGLVRQLLAFSRRQTLRPQILQLSDTLSDLRELLSRLVGEKIELDLKHGRDLWMVMADVNQFEQVIINLVVNARDAMPSGGRIELRTLNVAEQECERFHEATLTPADYVLIEIADTGTGIPEAVKEKIFEPFFTTKEVGKGTGLGLSMVYGIIKQTGGSIYCQSEVNKGTTFRIFLPRHIAPAIEAPIAPVDEARSAARDLTGRGTILLVEDEEAVRSFGARALASRGYSVLEAGSGVEALEVVEAKGGHIDLIVSDVVMPEMDGPTMLGELRKRGITCKVIFVSGYAEDAFEKNLPAGEQFGFLPKPFSLKQLIETVKTTLG